MPNIDSSNSDPENLDRRAAAQIVEFISQNKLDLGWLVEEVLQAHGYAVRCSPFGDDGSIEMLAEGGTGPLGFILPRVAILFKRSSESANPSAVELERFLALYGAAQGLFVSWNGFTDPAMREARRLFHQTKFWDVMDIVEQLAANYEKLSDRLKSELPLKRIWVVGRKRSDRRARFEWQPGDLEIHEVKAR